MYKNKSEHGLNNICGQKIRKFRLEMKNVSQRKLADMLQVQGLDVDKNAIQRMESGKRFITDIELKALAKVLNVTYAELLD
jgi:transcriptional regulator with XRE-family HTH domain